MGELVVGHPGAERVDEADLAAQPRLLEHAPDVGGPSVRSRAGGPRSCGDRRRRAVASDRRCVAYSPSSATSRSAIPTSARPEAVGDRAVLPPGAVGRAVGQHGQRADRPRPAGAAARSVSSSSAKAPSTAVASRHGLGQPPVDELASGDDVGDPRRRAEVVLEDQEAPLPIAHDVQAGDVGAAGEIVAGQRRLVVFGALDDVGGHDAGRHDPPLAVGVGHERGEGPNALHEPVLEAAPFLGGDQARYGIDEESAVGLLAERDAAAPRRPGRPRARDRRDHGRRARPSTPL